jgi:hypothetical protein
MIEAPRFSMIADNLVERMHERRRQRPVDWRLAERELRANQ